MTLRARQAERLSQVVACDDFAAIDAAVHAYAGALQAELSNLSPAQAVPVLHAGLATLESARRKVISARAGLLRELHSLPRPTAYHSGPQSEPLHTWKIEA